MHNINKMHWRVDHKAMNAVKYTQSFQNISDASLHKHEVKELGRDDNKICRSLIE